MQHVSIRATVRVLLASLALASTATAQIDFNISGFCKSNNTTQNLNPSLINPSVTIYECWSIGLPYSHGLLSAQLLTTGTLCEGLEGSVSFEAVNTPEEIANWGIGQVIPITPPFPILPCLPTAVIDYGRHSGNQDLYSFSIGTLFNNGPVITKHIQSEMTWNDTLTITSANATTIALPIGAVGSIFAAESFGTAATRGHAKLTVSGSVGGVAISETIEVESVSVVPEQASINLSRLVQVPLSAGSNSLSIQLCAQAEVTATAQGAGFIAGSATAGVGFGNDDSRASGGLSFGRFTDGVGGPLPNGIKIVSNQNGAIYEDTTTLARWAKMGFSSAGASGAPQLDGSGPLTGGQPIQLHVSNARPMAPGLMGIGYNPLYFPFAGGVVVPDFVSPGFIRPFVTDAAGQSTATFMVPAGLSPGFQAYFQGWILDPTGPTGLASATNGVQATTPR